MHGQNATSPASADLLAWRAANARTTCALQVGGFRPGGDALASHIGLPPAMPADQAWPLDLAGQPMECIAQLNLAQAPWLPEALRGLAMLQFFVGQQFIQSGCARGTWAIIERRSLQDLAPRAQPPLPERPWVGRGFEARWLPPQPDYPCYDDPDMRLPAGMHSFPKAAHGQCLAATKLGGYACSLQHSVACHPYRLNGQGVLSLPPDEPPYVLQIGSEPKAGLDWVDSGVVYLGRHPQSGVWDASCQFY